MKKLIPLAIAAGLVLAGCGDEEKSDVDYKILGDTGSKWIDVAVANAGVAEEAFVAAAKEQEPERGAVYLRIVCESDPSVILGTGRYAAESGDGEAQTGLDKGEHAVDLNDGVDCP